MLFIKSKGNIMTTITHSTPKLIKNLVFALALSCPLAWGNEIYQIKNPSGASVNLSLALTKEQHTHGLSGLKTKDFKINEGMLFVNTEMGPRRFWMPDTYFNLDIIFLDKDLKIVGIEKNVPAHPGNSEPPTIYKTETYNAQYVLETKSGASFSKKLKINDQLKFIGSNSISEIALRTRQQR
ncbi:MAG: DUF192 domain-containing protein, partial [Bacteriovorax sp.]|nr:DUF192 domain-containing protein [Bacteriovorax sp.]